MPSKAFSQLATADDGETISESPFYIPMTGPASRPRNALKHDDTFMVVDNHGDVGASAGGPDGLFHSDTRYLARLELKLDDVQPLLLGSNLRDDNSSADGRSHQSRYLPRRPPGAGEGRASYRAHHLPVARNRVPAHRPAEPRRCGGQLRSGAGVRQRLRRSVRSARQRAAAARRVRQPAAVGGRRRLRLSRAGRHYAQHRRSFRSGAVAPDGEGGDLSYRAGAATMHLGVRLGDLRQAAGAKADAILSQPVGASARDAARDRRHHLDRDLQQHLQRGGVPGDGRPQHADDGDAAGPLSLCRHSLVLDHVRPRRADHRDADAVGRSAHRLRRAAKARRVSGHGGRSAQRRRAGQDPARDARRRDGGAARGAVRAILRQRRFDAVVRAARWPVCRAHRRRRHARRSVAGDRGRVALDRRPRRSRRRWVRGVSARLRAGSRQSGLEGFLRRDLSCRRPPRRRLHRARRSAGLCVRRQTARGALREAARAGRQGRRAGARGGAAGETVRAGVLVPRARHLRAWRSTAPSSRAGCAAPTPDNYCSPASSARNAPA